MNIKWGKEKTDIVGYYNRFMTATVQGGGSYSIHFSKGYTQPDDLGEVELYYTAIQVDLITHYDMQEYAWARYDEDDELVEIIRDGRVLFRETIDGLQSMYDLTAEELIDIAEDDFGEFENMYDEWFCGVVEQIIILLEQENKKYNRIIDRT